MAKVKRVCKQCGKEFEVFPYRIREGTGVYCSVKCFNKSRQKRFKAICVFCGKEFETIPSQNKKFCSRGCYLESGVLNSNLKNRINVKCDNCGRVFEITPSRRIVAPNEIFCSRKCQGEWQTKTRIGKNSANWRGGVSFGKYCPKFNEHFKEYIRTKFDKKCFLCDKTEVENGRKLDVHHVSYNKACGCAETEENRKADDKTCQFVPLCISCNSKVNTNRTKWEQYFKNKLRNKLNGWYI